MKKQDRDTTPAGCSKRRRRRRRSGGGGSSSSDNDDDDESWNVRLKLCNMKQTESHSRIQNQNMLDMRLLWQ
jgi:hypothetical protein